MLLYVDQKIGWSLRYLFSSERITIQKKPAFSPAVDVLSLRYEEISSVAINTGFFTSKLIINQLLLNPELKFAAGVESSYQLIKDLIELGHNNIDELLAIIGSDNIEYRLEEAPAFNEETMNYDRYQKDYGNYVSPKAIIEHIKTLKESGAFNAPQTQQPVYEPQPAMDYSQAPSVSPGEISFMVSVGGQEAGPYTILELQQFVATGEFTPEVYVWRDGMPQWEFAGNVPELANIF